MANVKLEVMNPKGVLVSPEVEGLKVPRVTDLNGKKIALLAEKPDSMLFFNSMERLLKEAYPRCEIVHFPSYCSPVVGNNTKEVAANCDVWLQGVKTSTSSRVDGDVLMEKLGKPGVSFSVDALMPQKEVVAEINGIPTIRVVSIPSLPYFKAKADPVLMDEVAKSMFQETISALTTPLTEAEMNPTRTEYDYGNLVFEAETYEEAYQNFQTYCLDNDMGDGFPLIPPTRELVDKMLQGTSYPPDKEIGVVLPRGGMATVEKIAVNAVMAGAKPEQLPVIISMIDCITDKNFNQFHINTGILPVYWLSGPIVEEIGVNNEINYLGPGNRVNNAICRAAALCQINIGWRILSIYAAPGGAGRADNFTNYLIPENLKHGVWGEPFGVERGFAADESVVAVCEHLVLMRGPSETLYFGSFEDSMNLMANLFKVDAFHIGTGHSAADDIRYLVVIHPTFAHQLEDYGYTKASFLQWIYDHSAKIWDKMSPEQQANFRQEVEDGKWFGLKPEDCKSGLCLEPFSDPANVAIVVSGSCCGETMVFKTTCGSTAKIADCPEDFVARPFMIKPIHGATLTNAGK